MVKTYWNSGVVLVTHKTSVLILDRQCAAIVQNQVYLRPGIGAPRLAWRYGELETSEGDGVVIADAAGIVAGKDMIR